MPESIDDWVLPLISLFLIVIILMAAVLTITPQLFPSTYVLSCPRGYCSNNIYTGEKFCPPTDEGFVQFTPGTEVCNPRNGCSPTSETPCTYYDTELGTLCPGDPKYTGVCPDECRCLERVYCPDFVTAYFEAVVVPNSGIDPEGIISYRAFVQNTIWTSSTGVPRNDRPLSPGLFSQTPTTICGVSEVNLPLVWPPRTCLRGQFGLNEEDGLWYCMDLPFICGTGQYAIRYSDGTARCFTFTPDPFE